MKNIIKLFALLVVFATIIPWAFWRYFINRDQLEGYMDAVDKLMNELIESPEKVCGKIGSFIFIAILTAICVTFLGIIAWQCVEQCPVSSIQILIGGGTAAILGALGYGFKWTIEHVFFSKPQIHEHNQSRIT